MPPSEALTILFPLDSVPDPGAREAVVDGPDGPLAIFVVRRGSTVRAFVNQCPHLGVPLNWKPDTFLDPEGQIIVCAMHGATFGIDDGLCDGGPCKGRSLRPLAVSLRNGSVAVGGT